MRNALMMLALFSAATVSAADVDVLSMPSPVRPLAECETNVVFSLGGAHNNKWILAIELEASVSNCLEVVMGTDSNEDGTLAVNEGELSIGWDCGEWFLRDRHGGEIHRVETPDGTRRLELTMRLNADKTPRFISGNVFSGKPGATCFNPDWNLMRIVSRGATTLAVESKMSVDALTVRIR